MQLSSETELRQAGLSVLLASLIVTSGCAGLLPNTNEAETSTSTPEKRTNGTDLRSISFPVNGSITVSGELDHGDPKQNNKLYEPVQIDTVEGQLLNITMEAEHGNPTLRIVNPDGNVTQTLSSENQSTVTFSGRELSQSGRYTLEATSDDQNAMFNYTLTIEQVDQDDALFAGDGAQWNETEQYLSSGEDFSIATQGTTQYGTFPTNASKNSLRANATGDYLVVTYNMSPDLNFTQKNLIDVTLRISYINLIKKYKEFGNNSNTLTNVTWVPEIIFFKGVSNETGELHRTTFLTAEWAREYLAGGKWNHYAGWYYSTIRQGPGSPSYDPEDGITNEEFPQAYHNYTYPGDNSTLAERYGL